MIPAQTTGSDGQTTRQSSEEFRRPLVSNLRWIVAFFSLLVFVYTGGVAWRSWSEEKTRYVEYLSNITELEAKTIDGYFSSLQISLTNLGQDLAAEPNPNDLNQTFRTVKRFWESRPDLFNIALSQPDGKVLLTAKTPPHETNASLASQASFKEFIAQVEQGNLFAIGRPVMGAVLARAVVPVRLAVKSTNGNLLYIVSASVPLEHLQSFWMGASIAAKAAIGVIRDDGFLLSRYPVPPNLSIDEIFAKPRTGALINHLQKNGFPETGYVEGPSSLDGPDFINPFRRLQHFPATVFIAMPISEIQAAWWNRFQGTFYLSVILIIMGIAAAWYGLHRQSAWHLAQSKFDAALRESEQRYHDLFDKANEGLLMMTEDGLLSEVNQAFAQMHGYTVDELKSMDIRKLDVLKEQTYEARADVAERIRAGETVRFEVEHHHKNGRTFPLSVTVSRIHIAGQTYDLAFHQDITERKQADAALNISEERLRLAMDATQQGWFDLNIQTGEVVVSPSFIRMVGGDPDKFFINREGWVNSIHREDRDAVLQAYEKCLRSGEAQHMEYRMITKSGEWKWIHSAGKVVATDATGSPLRMTGTHADITERKRADQRFSESEERYRDLVERSPIGIFVHRDGKFLYLNPTATSLFGAKSATELIGKPILEIVHPDFRHLVQKRIENARSGILNPFNEQKLIRLDGSFFDAEIQGNPIQYQGTPAIQVSFVDISERKRLENNANRERIRLETILKMASDGIHVIDGDGLLVEANTAFLNMLGYDKSAIGKLCVTDWSGLEPWEVIKARNDELIARRGQALFEAPIRRRDGVILIAEINSSGIEIDGKGYLYAAIRDITERKRAEAKRVQLEEQLREAQKMESIGTLAGGIAHDFNNIIAAILGNVELAREDAIANPVALESLEEIRKAGARARELVRQILAFSRREPTQRQPIALAPVVEESARLLRATLPARVAIEVHCDAGIPLVEADHTQIQQVLLNLGTNAMQAMNGSPGHIFIRLDTVALGEALAGVHPVLDTLRQKHPGRIVRLVVNDDGPGMEAAIVERIFEPFFTTKPVGEGTGLGLSVVHGIVQSHDGAIVVEGTPGKGATFTIYLPVAKGEPAQTDTPASEEAKVIAAAAPATAPALSLDGGQHILYLDDDESLMFLVKRLLERRGYRVSGYINQSDALAAVRADPAAFDLVLTDYNMPGMSGLDVAREVRSIRVDLPVAIASGFIDETLRAEAVGAGARELIFKADAVEEFCAVVQRLAQVVVAPAQL